MVGGGEEGKEEERRRKRWIRETLLVWRVWCFVVATVVVVGLAATKRLHHHHHICLNACIIFAKGICHLIQVIILQYELLIYYHQVNGVNE